MGDQLKMGRREALADRHILVVEDECLIMTDLALALERAGADVIGPVASIDDALALLATRPKIDAAILDINLQGIMVYPLADILEARGIPFIFATGYDAAAIPKRYDRIKRFQKPFEISGMVSELSKVH